jgi:hypothetical protein
LTASTSASKAVLESINLGKPRAATRGTHWAICKSDDVGQKSFLNVRLLSLPLVPLSPHPLFLFSLSLFLQPHYFYLYLFLLFPASCAFWSDCLFRGEYWLPGDSTCHLKTRYVSLDTQPLYRAHCNPQIRRKLVIVGDGMFCAE